MSALALGFHDGAGHWWHVELGEPAESTETLRPFLSLLGLESAPQGDPFGDDTTGLEVLEIDPQALHVAQCRSRHVRGVLRSIRERGGLTASQARVVETLRSGRVPGVLR